MVKRGFGSLTGLHDIGLRDAELGECGLERAAIEDRDPHGVVRRQRPGEQLRSIALGPSLVLGRALPKREFVRRAAPRFGRRRRNRHPAKSEHTPRARARSPGHCTSRSRACTEYECSWDISYIQSNDMPRALRAAARGSSRQARRTVESIESEGGESSRGAVGGRRMPGRAERAALREPQGRPRSSNRRRRHGRAASHARSARRAGRPPARRAPGRLAGSRIDSQRQRRHQEEREQELG